MAWRIVWSHTAVEDLREIVQFIARESAEAAGRLAERLVGRIEQAAALPFSNRAVPEKADATIREVILRPYRIIYYVDERREAIHILRIWHAARGIPDL